jgi:methionine sulfoxide reductase heme-binding subunit
VQLMNERQRFPFVIVCVVAVIVIGIAFLTTHFIDPAPALANKTYWYLERSAGFTSYGLLSIAVLLGVSSSTSVWDKWNMRKLMTQMHQYVSLLVFPFLFFHLWGLYMDKSIPFRLMQFLIPFTSNFRAMPTGLGVLTVYAWVILIVSSYVREKIGVKMWRAIHILSFPMFIAATFHGFLSGTDSSKHWAILVYLIPTVLFVILLSMRVKKYRKTPVQR